MSHTTLTRGTTTLVLSHDLRWIDDLSWSPVMQSKVRSITGAWIIDSMPRQGGRPITLAGDATSGLLARADLLTLHSWLETPEEEFQLLHMGVTHTVIWDHGDGEESQAITSEPFVPFSDPLPGDWCCNVRLRFLKKD